MCFHILPLFQSCLLIYQYYWCLNISVFFICIFIVSLFVVVMCCVLNMLHPRKLLHIFFHKFNVLMSWVHWHLCVCVRVCACVHLYVCLFMHSCFSKYFIYIFFPARRKLLWIKLRHNKEVFRVTVTNKKELLTRVVFIITWYLILIVVCLWFTILLQ